MTTFELARKYGISMNHLQNIIMNLRIRGYEFTRKGRKYDFTEEDLKVIENEIQRRGYKPATPEIPPKKTVCPKKKPVLSAATYEIVKKYGINIGILYSVLNKLKRDGFRFKKIGRSFVFSPVDIAVIEREIQRRGYHRKDTGWL